MTISPSARWAYFSLTIATLLMACGGGGGDAHAAQQGVSA